MARLCVIAFVLFAGTCCLAKPSRIVGGEVTFIEKYPFVVQVEYMRTLAGAWAQSCAATILNNRYVVSAAHCFDGVAYHPRERRIRAGATNRNLGGSVSYVEREINHPSWGQASVYDGDISVVRLITPLVYSMYIQQGSIINQGFVVPDNQPVVHAGWGATREGGASSSQLRDVTIYTINHELCRTRYLAINDTVTRNMICAGILDVGGRDACQGDSGGPLLYQNILVGVVSWARGCADKTYPGVSTAVSSYTNWIIATAV